MEPARQMLLKAGADEMSLERANALGFGSEFLKEMLEKAKERMVPVLLQILMEAITKPR